MKSETIVSIGMGVIGLLLGIGLGVSYQAARDVSEPLKEANRQIELANKQLKACQSIINELEKASGTCEDIGKKADDILDIGRDIFNMTHRNSLSRT